MIVPEFVVPIVLRATRANAIFLTAEAARERVRERALRPASCAPPKRLPGRVRLDVRRNGPNVVYTVTPADGPATGQVVYVHGGGWVSEIRRQHWVLIAEIAARARVRVTVPIYQLLPHGSAQLANDLVVEEVHRLLRRHPDVRLAGDSAGGQISLSAAQTLRDQGVPEVRTVLISPALDQTYSNPEIPSVQPHDPWLALPGGAELARQWAGDLPVTDPVVSPLTGAMAGLGPMLLISGTHDVLNPDAHLLVDKARREGVEVDFVERPGAVHVYPLVGTRSGRRARAAIVEALRS